MDNLSYQLIKNMRDDTLDYLTTTGLTITGGDLNNENNLLITDYEAEHLYRDTVTGEIIAKSWSATIERRTIEPASTG